MDRTWTDKLHEALAGADVAPLLRQARIGERRRATAESTTMPPSSQAASASSYTLKGTHMSQPDSDVGSQIEQIVSSLGLSLPEAFQRSVLHCVKYGEWAIALETLCDAMAEVHIVPNQATYDRIMNVASRLRLDDKYRRAVRLPPDVSRDTQHKIPHTS